MEFTPFEYGMAKYGVFGNTDDFGGKFYKGSLVKKFEESPLSYLQGDALPLTLLRHYCKNGDPNKFLCSDTFSTSDCNFPI